MRRLIILGLIALAACDDPGTGIIDTDRNGVLAGIAYVDRDADARLSGPDVVAVGVRAALLREASGDTVAQATTRNDGTFVMTNVPVGRYRLVAALGALGDTLQVQKIDSASVTITVADTAVRSIRIGYPVISAAEFRTAAAGRRYVVEGIALTGWSTYGDATLHVADGTGSLRAIRVLGTAAQSGDSVRVLGTAGVSSGRPVLADALAHIAASARGLPPVDSVGTGAAATAAGGTRADGQVRIAGAIILDTATVAGHRILGVDDGSGRLEVVLDQAVSFNPGPYVPGGTFAGAGVLVPPPSGDHWRLRPRDRNEAAVTFPSISIAAARAAEAGRRVVVEAVALNNWVTFGDSTLHVVDATGAMRAVRVTVTSGTIIAGDSIRLLGTIGTRNGQPVITAATASLLLRGVGAAEPDSVSTSAAASANAGALDAYHVKVAGEVVGTQAMGNGDVALTVNDGSGALVVLLDRDVSFPSYNTGVILTATGVLVPTGTGTWQLKPRSSADLSATWPTVTIADARQLPAGKTVYVHGLALNARSAYSDGAVHVFDRSDAIRVLNLPASAAMFAGDSVRVLGTVAMRNGQPVLINASGSVLLSGVGLPAPDSLSTEDAASANAGDRDAWLVAISGTISAVTNVSGGLRLTVSDGSGNVFVFLDQSLGYAAGNYVVGATVQARGVLVPETSGTTWLVKPRTLGDVSVTAP